MTARLRTDLDIAREILTPAQLDAFELRYRGLSKRTIALALGISRSTVQSRLENAHRKISAARKDAAA